MNFFQTLRWHPSGAQAKCGPCFVCLVRCVALYCDHDTLQSTQCYVRGFVRKTCLQNPFKIGMFCKCPLLLQETNLAQAIQITQKMHEYTTTSFLCCTLSIDYGMCAVMVWYNYFFVSEVNNNGWRCELKPTDSPMYRAWTSCKRRNLPAIMGWSC